MNTELFNEISKIDCGEIPLTEAEKKRVMSKIHRKLPKKHGKLRVIAKAAGALAACYALLIGVSAVNPVLADTFPIIRKLPFADKIIYSLNHTEGHSFQSPVIRSGAVENYLTAVAGSEDADFRIVESYCDGTALILSVVMKVENTDAAVKYITPVYNISINGTPVTVSVPGGERADLSEYFYNLIRVDKTVYAGSVILDVSNFDLAETLDLSIKPVELVGVDDKHMVQTGLFSDSYTPKTYAIHTVPDAFQAEIPVDASLKRTYEVNETQDAVTLNSVTVSPSFTSIDTTLSGDQSDDPLVMYLYDSEGNSIPWLKFGFETDKTYYKPVLKDTASITAKFYRKSDRKTCVAEFNVPVEGGFADVYEPPVERADDGGVVYDPPYTAPETNRPANAKVFELGQTAVTEDGLAVTYSNMRVFNSIEEAGISPEDMNGSAYNYYSGNSDYRFVTFDLNLKTGEETRGSEIMDKEAEEYEKFGENSSTFWITDYFNPTLIDGAYDLNNSKQYRIYEPAYFSSAMRGVTNYYHFIMNPNEERDFVVGAYVAAADLESGNFQVLIHYSGSSSSSGSSDDQSLYLNIPPYTE